MVSSGLAPYKLPRALDSLLIYQQPSSTTLYCSYPGILTLIEVRSRNETGEITSILTRLSLVAQSRAYGLLRPQHPSRMHKVGIAQEEPRHNIGLNCIQIDLHICWVLDRLTPYKLPRALVSLLLYQQSSSTTSPCSYALSSFIAR